jgi:hypothetical protein
MIICHSDLIRSLPCVALTHVEINRLVAHLFDKDPPTLQSSSMFMPFSSENPPLAVRVSSFANVLWLLSYLPLITLFHLLTQRLYPNHHTDVDLSSGDKDVLKVPTGDDAEGEGVTSVEQIAPSLISSNVLEQAQHSTTDQADIVAPSIDGQKRKHPPPILKRKQSKPSADQVMTQIKLPPYRRPRSTLDLVAIEIIFGCLFEAFRHAPQAVYTGTSTNDEIQPSKKTRVSSLNTIIVPR